MIVLLLFFYFFPVLFTIIGIICIVTYYKTQKRNELCTCQTTGKVIKIIKSSRRYGQYGNGSTYRRYFRVPCFQYFVNGRAYTVRGYSAKLHPLNSSAPIYYNPFSPDMAHTGEKGPGLKIGISSILSAVLYLIFFGVMSIVLFYLP